MPFKTASGTVTSTAIVLANPSAASASDPAPVVIFNNSTTDTLYIGGPAVTTDTGFPILKQTGISFRLISGEVIYGISAGSVDVRVLMGRS